MQGVYHMLTKELRCLPNSALKDPNNHRKEATS